MAQGSAKLQQVGLFTQNTRDQFATLDDVYDNNALRLDQGQDQTYQLSLGKYLMHPALYFTIALVFVGVQVFAAPTEQAELVQHQMPPSAVQGQLKTELASLDDSAQTATSISSAMPRVQLPVQDSPAAVPTMQKTISDESGTFDQSGSSLVLEDAMKACREGQPGSYANFCKALSAARAGQL